MRYVALSTFKQKPAKSEYLLVLELLIPQKNKKTTPTNFKTPLYLAEVKKYHKYTCMAYVVAVLHHSTPCYATFLLVTKLAKYSILCFIADQ